jgi:hypothetical protein
MARLVTTLLAVLALSGCDIDGETPQSQIATPGGAQGTRAVELLSPCRAAPARPRSTPTQLVVQAIHACEVKRILIAHDDTMWITYRGGKTVPIKRLNPWAIQRATERVDACNVLIDIE